MRIKSSKTNRGFKHFEFKDRYNHTCSIQESSAACDYYIWLGIDNVVPRMLAQKASAAGIKTDKTCGWIDVPLHPDIHIFSRMHLNRKDCKTLGLMLLRFAETGELIKPAPHAKQQEKTNEPE